MRVKIVRTPGELRDEIGHKVMVRKDWKGTVVRELDEDEFEAAGFHPKLADKVYMVRFDKWETPIAVPEPNLVVLDEDAEEEEEG